MACALWRPPEPCSIPTCDNPARKVGYCQGHYSRLLAGDLRPDEPLRPRGKSGGPCAREGCPRSARVRGLCRTHYTLRWRETNAATCTVDTCDTSPVVAQGLCEMHYGRLRRPGAPRLDAPARPYNWGGTTCTVEGCPQRAVALGWCGMHRKRVMVNGVPGDAAPIIVVDRIRERLRRKPLRRPRAGHHTVDEWQAKLDEYDGLCFYCDRPATTRDHWIPVSKGGPDTIDNIVPACTSCNSRKRDKLPAVFLAELEDLDDG